MKVKATNTKNISDILKGNGTRRWDGGYSLLHEQQDTASGEKKIAVPQTKTLTTLYAGMVVYLLKEPTLQGMVLNGAYLHQSMSTC